VTSRRIIVVGAGPAGCTAAIVLAEAGHSVTVVEAGPKVAVPPPTDVADALAMHGRSGLGVVRSSAQSSRDYCAGAGVGGSTLVNGLLMVRPNAAQLAHDWALPGWTEAVLSAAFARVFAGRAADHVLHDGVLTTGVHRSIDHHVSDAHGNPADHADVEQVARLLVPVSLRSGSAEGRTWGSASWVVEPTYVLGNGSERPLWGGSLRAAGVDVRAGVGVDRILFEGTLVTGVGLRDGSVLGAAQVVLCAGAIESPRLLWRSGVTLAGIGRNLCDHPSISFTDEAAAAIVGASTAPISLRPPGGQPDVLITAHSGSGVLLTLLRTQSRGLLTADAISLDQLEAADDLTRMRGLLRSVADLDPALVGPGDLTIRHLAALSDHDLDVWLRQHEDGTFHMAGTCRMGLTDDPRSVSTPDGAVVGTTGLYVADASVFPSLPAAPPLATVIAVADILAHAIPGE
jgi:choline dehydrogenase